MTTEIETHERNRELNQFAMALYRNIEEVHMAVLGITQYKLVPAPEFPGTTRYISALQEMS